MNRETLSTSKVWSTASAICLSLSLPSSLSLSPLPLSRLLSPASDGLRRQQPQRRRRRRRRPQSGARDPQQPRVPPADGQRARGRAGRRLLALGRPPLPLCQTGEAAAARADGVSAEQRNKGRERREERGRRRARERKFQTSPSPLSLRSFALPPSRRSLALSAFIRIRSGTPPCLASRFSPRCSSLQQKEKRACCSDQRRPPSLSCLVRPRSHLPPLLPRRRQQRYPAAQA